MFSAVRSVAVCLYIFLGAPGLANAQSPLERAVTLARARNYEQAREALQNVPEPATPTQRIAFHRLKAAVAAGLAKPAEAASEMRQALHLAPSDSALLLATAVAEQQAGEAERALQHASQADKSAPGKKLIADIQESRNKIPEAIAAYREAIELDPANEEYAADLAFTQIRQRFFGAAASELSPAIARFPESTRLRTLFGIALYAAGEIEMAVESLSATIARDPAAEPAYRCLSQIVLQSSAAPASHIVAQLCTWDTTVCSALKLRQARDRQDGALLSQATAALETAAALPQQGREDGIVAHCELARAREWSDRLPDARAELEACVAGNPSAQNHYRLALLYRRLGLPALAQHQLERRTQLLQGMSEQTANGLNALKSLP